MNVLCIYSVGEFVFPDRPLAHPEFIPFGISMVATVLKRAGHNVRLLVFTPATPVRALLKQTLRRFHPQLACFSGVSTQIDTLAAVARCLRKLCPSCYIVLGGHHAVLNPEQSAAFAWLDAVCTGEGERAVLELARRLQQHTAQGAASTAEQLCAQPGGAIANLWLRCADGQIIRGCQEPFHQDLDSLPFIDRAMWDPWIYRQRGRAVLLVGRGCPNRCAYCSNHAIARRGHGRYVRFRSPQNVVAELRELVRLKPETREVYLEVETLSANLDFARSLLAELKEFNSSLPRSLIFGVNLHPTPQIVADTALLEQFRAANFRWVNVGLESGSERLRRQVLRRPPYSNEQLVRFCQLAKEHSISVRMFVILGLPSETLAEYRQTVDCLRRCQPAHLYASMFYPYPGTDLYELCRRQNLLRRDPEGRIAGLERKRPALNQPSFPAWRVRREYLLLDWRVYRGILPLRAVLVRMARTFMSSTGWLDRLYRRLVDGAGFLAGIRRRHWGWD
jgi:radical SAM superfamily enzyme YgiQ (UPF0313 family)